MSKNNVIRMLDSSKIPYTLHTLPKDRKLSGIETAQMIGVPPEIVYKTIVISRIKSGKHILALIPATHQVDLKAISDLINEKKVVLTSQKQAETITGLLAGEISPLALINRGFQVILDVTALSFPEIHISGGQRDINICISVEHLIGLTNADIGKISKRIASTSSLTDG